MTDQITLYYRNALADVVGTQQGLATDELDALAPAIQQITADMDQQRAKGQLPYRDLPYQQEMAQQVHNLAAKLKGRFDNLLVLGIGGSALGNIALQTALNDPLYNLTPHRTSPRLFVMDNVDPVQFRSLLHFLQGQWDRTLVNVISKSGQTAETASQFLIIKDLLTQQLGPERLKDHLIATTDPASGTLRRIADDLNLTTLQVPPGVGGRFSVLSHVGLFSAALCGIDIDQLLAGARDMDQRLKNPNLRQNPAALYAAIQFAFYKKHKNLSVMMPYSYQLKDLCDWYRQLWAESLGKQTDLDGNTVNTGPTPIKALGATDQHSQVQLYREGPHDKIFTFLQVDQFQHDVPLPSHVDAPELTYLADHSLAHLLNSEKRATEYALLQSQRPCLTVAFPEISPYTVGQFIYLFETATSYMGALLNINTYDQPAVELGKIATFALMNHPDHQKLLHNIQQSAQPDPNFLI